MDNKEELARRLAYEYQFRKFTNTKDYTSAELDDFFRRQNWLAAVNNQARCENIRDACVRYTSYCK